MYAIFSLSIVVLAVDQFSDDVYETRSQKDLKERCLPFSNESLWWKTNGYVDIQQNNKDDQVMKKKSVVKFYGGLTQDDFFEGEGGLIGTTMILSDDGVKCSKKPSRTRFLIEETASSRTFAQLPSIFPKDFADQTDYFASWIPFLSMYGLTGSKADLSQHEHIAVRHVLETSRSMYPFFEGRYNKIAFKSAGSDEYKILDCGENAYNVTSYRLEMIPGWPMDIDLSNVFAVFGDHNINKASVRADCGTNTSEGCPLDAIDRKLIGEIPGVHDTMLPSKSFKITNRRDIRVNFKRLTETLHYMDFVLPIQDGYATKDNQGAKNRFFFFEWQYNRVNVPHPCARTPKADPMPPDQPGFCANVSAPEIERLENIVRNYIPDIPPERGSCGKDPLPYLFCTPNTDTGATIYLAECPKPPNCTSYQSSAHSQPWFGFFGSTPHSVALAKTDETLDRCIKKDHWQLSPVVAAVITGAAAAAAAAAAAGIYCAIATGGGAAAASGGVAAAATASALLTKYGLAAREKASEQEYHIGNMLSTDVLEVKDAPTLPLKDCVEYAIERAYNGEDIDDSDSLTGSGYLIEPTLSPTRGTYGMVEMVQTPSTSEKDSTETKLPVAETVPNMSEKDVKVLRVKTNASTAWSEDEERGNKIDGMSNDEAAAIMLYTQETCMFRNMNAALRLHNYDALQPYLPFMKLLLTALYKLPLVEAEVYRGVKADLAQIYNQLVDHLFTWWSFTSTSRDTMITSFLGKNGKRTKFSIRAIGVDIATFSASPFEEEVLLLPGARLRTEAGINSEEDRDMWTFNLSVSKEDLPLIDFRHPESEKFLPGVTMV